MTSIGKGALLFLGGVLFGTAGIKVLSSKDAKKAYTHCTAAVLRAKNSVIAILAVKAARYIWKALKCLSKGKLEVSVLDATAITVSLIRRDFKTADSVMFLLEIGEILREYFSQDEAKDAARLSPCKDDNEVLRKIDRKDCLFFI